MIMMMIIMIKYDNNKNDNYNNIQKYRKNVYILIHVSMIYIIYIYVSYVMSCYVMLYYVRVWNSFVFCLRPQVLDFFLLFFPVPFALYLQQFGTRTCRFAWYLLHFGMVTLHFAWYLLIWQCLPSILHGICYILAFQPLICMVFAAFWCFKRSCGSLEGSKGFI